MKGCFNKVGNSWGFTLTIGKDANGKRKQKRFGKYTTKKDAEKACAEMIYQIDNNLAADPKKITLATYLRQWLENYRPNMTICTYDGYSNNIEKHIIPSLGNIPLQKLHPMQIQSFYNDKLKNGRLDKKGGLSVSSIRYIHATLRKALNDAVKMQYLVRNVSEFVDPPKSKAYEAKFLTKTEVDRMLLALKDSNIFVPILLAVGLGLRRGEVLGLQWEDVDFENKRISIKRSLLPGMNGYYFSDLKTAKSKRVLTVPQNIMDYLKREKKRHAENKLFFGGGYKDINMVCCNEDGSPISPASLNHRFSAFLKKNNIPHLRIHDLRHTNASLMLKQGISMKVASDRLGHTTIGITMDLYTHVDDELQQDAAERLNKIISV